MAKKKSRTTKPFVIMLDNWMEVFPAYWPITGAYSTLAAAQRAASYSGGNPRLMPKAQKQAKIIENKSLRNARTGAIEAGAIYELV